MKDPLALTVPLDFGEESCFEKVSGPEVLFFMRAGQALATMGRNVRAPDVFPAEALHGVKEPEPFLVQYSAHVGRVGYVTIGIDEPQEPTLVGEVNVEGLFDLLAQTWAEQTQLESSLTAIFMHPAYQQIIGLGKLAVPYLLKRLRHEPEAWLWALRSITREDPAPEGAGPAETVAAWQRWASDHGCEM